LPIKIPDLGKRPLIMGILNITPDSFSDGGKFINKNDAIEQALFMAESGADILDIGGESSRPGAEPVTVDDELNRVIPVIEAIRNKVDIPISIDTVKSEVAKAAIKSGADVINDISALGNDEKIAKIASKKSVSLILMHMRGSPRDMQINTDYDDLIGEIYDYLNNAAEKAVKMGVKPENIIIDPGIGFGKSVDGNFTILKQLNRFKDLGYPLLVGASRKSFIGKTLNLDVDQRLEGSIAASIYAVLNGADIVRVHDVQETKRALTILEKVVTTKVQ
jgi:dihydropteroate synthase